MASSLHLTGGVLRALVLVVLVAAAAGVGAQDRCYPPTQADNNNHPAPDYTTTLSNSYTFIVEMTEEIENVTYYVEEMHERKQYHIQYSDTVGVKVISNGSIAVYHYYPQKNEFVEEYDEECRNVGDAVGVKPWGWYDVDPQHGEKSYGPSSILRLAFFMYKNFTSSDVDVNGLLTEEYTTCTQDGGVLIRFMYSQTPPWLMPEMNMFADGDNRIPVEMRVDFMDGSKKYKYHVVEFLPYVSHHSNLEPGRGKSCEGMVGMEGEYPLPQIPWHFSMAEEAVMHSIIDNTNIGGPQHIDLVQVTYAGKLSLTSLLINVPSSSESSRGSTLKIIDDFNTGVEYAIDTKTGNCSMYGIPPFGYDHTGGFGTMVTMLSPNDLFHLNGEYAFMGQQYTRGIQSDRLASTRIDDIPDYHSEGILQTYPKAVLEYYFAQGLEQSPDGSAVFVDQPLRGDLFIYNSSNLNQVVSKGTINLCDFRSIELYSPVEFSVGECYSNHHDDHWSYLDIFFPATDSQMDAAQKSMDSFQHGVFLNVIELGRLSPVRVAAIDVSVGVAGMLPNTTNSNSIIARVQMLDRAGYIYSFQQPNDEPNPVPGNKETRLIDVRSKDDCAAICFSNLFGQQDCLSFHYCHSVEGEACFLSSSFESDGDPVTDVTGCEHWLRKEANVTFPDYPSSMAFKEIESAIHHGLFVFAVPYQDSTMFFEAKESVHYNTPDPMDPIRMQFYLQSRTLTVKHPDAWHKVKDLDECLVMCVTWSAFRCETAIHMTEEHDCYLLHQHFTDINSTELVPHSHSYVHSRSYIFDYKPVLGGVSINTTGVIIDHVYSAEECASYCSHSKNMDTTCQSFEFCSETNQCRLHEDHFLDVVDGGDYITGTTCIHFSRKTENTFTLYSREGQPPSMHKLVASNSDSSACAKLCVDDPNEVCQSFDFCTTCQEEDYGVCGEEQAGMSRLCFLSTHHVGEDGFTLVVAPDCQHYSRELFGDMDYPTFVAQQRKSDKPYTSGSMAGLAFGMIFLGILVAVGILALMINLKPASVPKDLNMALLTFTPNAVETID